MVKTRIEKNFYQLTTYLRIQGILRTNNNSELTYRTSLTNAKKKKYKTEERIISKLISIMKYKTLKKVTAM